VKVLVTGSDGLIGKALVKTLQELTADVTPANREVLDHLNLGDLSRLGEQDIVFLLAGKTRFIDCESDPTAYRVNVDAQLQLARHFSASRVVFVSSEAVEKALHTNYGMHKALAETGLWGVCAPRIGRICKKVTPQTLQACCDWLAELPRKPPGVYRWE
jgi:nucleoside-diphosphate-sugar epimerase